MTWDEFYEKSNYWAVSTIVNKIGSLEDMGVPDEIVDVLNIIGFEDKKGATRLLNRALQQGVKFSGENLVEICDSCSEEGFKNALYQSADKLTATDLEDMYGCIDDELIIDIAKKYQISAPGDIAGKYEEKLCTDVTSPISWSSFYNNYENWDSGYASTRSRALSDFGNEDEVIEVVNVLFGKNRYEASRFIQRAVLNGVTFGVDNLLEISVLCDAQTTRKAVLASNSLLNEDSLEELYGNIDDNVIIEAANMCKLKLPEEMREEYEEEPENEEDTKDELMWKIQSATQAADYALQCLYNAQEAMYDSSNVSFINMMNKGFLTSLWKYSSLSDADSELQIAQNALQNMNIELQDLLGNKTVQLNYKSLASAFDLWVESDFMDCLVHLQIGRAQKKIRQAIKQVEAIRRELGRIL
ncbi:MAG: hypothetical protein ACI4GD_04150 [Lachnospiraceae bacterium]